MAMGMGSAICDHTRCLAAADGLFRASLLQSWLKLWRTVAIVRDKGFNKVIFASECLSLIQHIKSLASDCTP
jgi:hypothetical protein